MDDNFIGITAICGNEGTCKTTMALSFPKPLVHFDTDVGGYRRAAWRLSKEELEQVESKSYPKPFTTAQMNKLLGQTGTPSTRVVVPKKVDGMKELWQQFAQDFVDACMNPETVTLIVDSSTALWNICHKSHLQELQERQLANHLRTKKGIPFDENEYREKLLPVEYCLHPDTRVLLSNLTWQKIDDILIGDELIGFDETAAGRGIGRFFKRSIVESTNRTTIPAYLICLSDDTYIIASSNHGWLTSKHFSFPSNEDFTRSYWKTTAELERGSILQSIGEPWTYDTSRDGGYLEGVYDGEGWVEEYGVSFRQNYGVVLDKTDLLLNQKNFEHGRYADSDGKADHLKIGGLSKGLRFLGSIRPERLLQAAPKLWEGKGVRKLIDIFVTSIIPLPPMELIDIQTSTKTFIAEGILTHNSPANDKMRTVLHTARSYSKNLILTHYPTDEYGVIPDAKGNMVEGKTGKQVMDGFKETEKLSDVVMWLSIKETIDKGNKIRSPIARITKCGLEGMGLDAIGLEIPASYEGIINLQRLMRGE